MNTIKWLSSSDDLSEVLKIRKEVFVNEQGVPPEIEFDGTDKYAISVLIYENELPVATGRIILIDENYTLGRICVLKDFRDKKYGKLVVEELARRAKYIGASTVHVHAQTHVVDFYKKLGYETYGDEYKEAGILHINMSKKLG